MKKLTQSQSVKGPSTVVAAVRVAARVREALLVPRSPHKVLEVKMHPLLERNLTMPAVVVFVVLTRRGVAIL